MRRAFPVFAAVFLGILGLAPVVFAPKPVVKADGNGCYWKNVKDQGPIHVCPQIVIMADGSDPMPTCRKGHPNCPQVKPN